jgi:propionate catabolism regulator PrpR
MVHVQVGIVAPYEELGRLCEEVCLELSEKAEVRVGNLTAGVQLARELERSGADVIITRGGTGSLIERAVQVPVVRIEVSTLDIMRALIEARKHGCVIGVIGFRSVIYGIEELAELLEVEVVPIEIESEVEVESRLRSTVGEGIDVVVGDVISTKVTSRFGLHNVLICSGKQAIKQAIVNAKHVAKVRIHERQRAQELSAILEFAHEGIIGVGPDCRIRVFNPGSERVLGVNKEDAIGLSIGDVIPGVSMERIAKPGKIRVGELRQIGQTTIATTCVPIKINDRVTGAVITFQDVTRIQQLEEKVRKELRSKGHIARYTFDDIRTVSKPMKDVIHQARKYARVDSTVLIIGETGTGKELFAQSIHNDSNRKEFPFVAINCAAMPETLLESELFGYEEGAFTGARRGGKKGVFEQAHRGTIFLDEIGEMPVELQSRLLRVIEEQEVMRVGGDGIIPVDVRIIAATNVNLKDAIEKGLFRGDLYYRLSALMIQVPPLRDRIEDIAMFAEEFLLKYTRKLRQPPKRFESEAMRVLQAHSWPGNVRELDNVIQRVVVSVSSTVIGPNEVIRMLHQDGVGWQPISFGGYGGTLKDLEQEAIRRALAATGGNRKHAAEVLGISRATLWRRLSSISND